MLNCNKAKIRKVPDSCFYLWCYVILARVSKVVPQGLENGGGFETAGAVNCVKIRGDHLLSSVYNNRTKVVSDQTKFMTIIEIKSEARLTPALLCRSRENKDNISGQGGGRTTSDLQPSIFQ